MSPLPVFGSTARALGPAAALLAVAAGAYALARLVPDADALVAFASARWPDGPATAAAGFVVAATLWCAFGLPRQGPSLVGGWAFGVAGGTAAAVLASTLGAALAFGAARWLGRPRIARRFPDAVDRLDALVAGSAFAGTLALRLLPVGSNLATNLAAGIVRVDARTFLAASAIGYVPQSLAFALAGHGAGRGSGPALAAALLVLVGSLVWGERVRRARRR